MLQSRRTHVGAHVLRALPPNPPLKGFVLDLEIMDAKHFANSCLFNTPLFVKDANTSKTYNGEKLPKHVKRFISFQILQKTTQHILPLRIQFVYLD